CLLDVVGRPSDLAVQYISQHPSMADEPGIFAVYEPLHAFPHVFVRQGSPDAGHESIKPLCLQAEIDVLVVCWKEHNVLPTGFLCQVSIDFHVLVTNEKHMPAAVLAVYERRIQLDGNIVLMCRLPWLLHIVPGTNDEGQNDGN